VARKLALQMHTSGSVLKVIIANTKRRTEEQTRNWVIAVLQLYKERTGVRQTIRVFHIEKFWLVLKTSSGFTRLYDVVIDNIKRKIILTNWLTDWLTN